MDSETKTEARLRQVATERAKNIVNLQESVLTGNQDIPQDRLDAMTQAVEGEARKKAAWIEQYEAERQRTDSKLVAEFALHQAALAGDWDAERIKLAEQERERAAQK